MIEEITSNMYQYPLERTQAKKAAGVYELDSITAMNAKIEQLEKAMERFQKPAMVAQICDMCGGGHPNHECQTGNVSFVEGTTEDANYVSNFRWTNDPYSNTYNPGWRNHPNFAWANKNSDTNQPKQYPPLGNEPKIPVSKQYPPGFENIVPKFEEKAGTDGSTLQQLLMMIQRQEQINQQITAQVKNLERTVTQLAMSTSERQQGTLPSNSETNPREQVKAITLRSGKTLVEPSSRKQEEEKEKEPKKEEALQPEEEK